MNNFEGLIIKWVWNRGVLMEANKNNIWCLGIRVGVIETDYKKLSDCSFITEGVAHQLGLKSGCTDTDLI